MKREVELVSTGTELLTGRTLNRHAYVLGERLQPLGLTLLRDTSVPDDLGLIEGAVAAALERVDIVLVSGGLGPTSDDVTRDAVARHLKRGIVMDKASVTALRQRYQAIGRVVTEQAERQALVVEGATALPNSVGVSPGERIELPGKVLFMLPGPPREFQAVLDEQVLPWIRGTLGVDARPQEKIFLVCGIGESDIVTRFEDRGFPPAGIDAAYCAGPGRVEVRLASRGVGASALDDAASLVRGILGDNIFAEERIDMADVVGRLLVRQKATLAAAESCTGGFLGHRITSVSGSSRYFLGGVVAYSNEVKMRELGVGVDTLAEAGAVSEEVARQMATGVRTRFEADYGLAVTGIAGPTGGTPEKPVGLVYIALADARRSWVRQRRFAGDRSWIKEWASQAALDLLRRRLQGVLGD